MNLIAFQFDASSIGVIDRAGNPWFVASDVCATLNLGNTTTALLKLDADERGVCSVETLGGTQQCNVISEAGLYTLILRCRDATTPGSVAHRFRKWVTGTVLPQIRKAGQFSVPRTFGEALRLAADLEQQKTELVAKVEEQAPKVAALARIAEASGSVTFTVAAKHLDMGRKQLLRWLLEMKWIYKPRPGGPWIAYETLIANGSLEHKMFVYERDDDTETERASTQALVTPHGLTRLAEMVARRKLGQERAAREALAKLAKITAEPAEEVLH